MNTKSNRKNTNRPPGNLLRGAIMLLILVLFGYIAFAPMFPTRVVPANAPEEQFSAERALAHLPIIASEPHPQGSPAQAIVRDYLVRELEALGLDVQIQKLGALENVVARLHGTGSGEAILIQTHYDSTGSTPGAADNGSGVAALLEIMRALSTDLAYHNDIIALFDDGEEGPEAFSGTKAFVGASPWMADVKVAIGMDTAAKGYISTDDTGPENGWLVPVLARAYTGGSWHSVSGGGTYDSVPFRNAGIQVVELEDNYPFYQQHTPGDVPALVKPATLQQLGDQALSILRELADRDLSVTKGEPHAFTSLSFFGFIHYPESWSMPLAILGGILFIAALVLALVGKLASWRGLGLAFLAVAVTAGLGLLGANALWEAAPGLFGWETSQFPMWPEVIPPHGWLIMILTQLVVLAVFALLYRLVRRWGKRADFSLVGLLLTVLFSVFFVLEKPAAAILATWPVVIGSSFWLVAALVRREGQEWPLDMGSMATAIPTIMMLLGLLIAMFTGDGTKSAPIISGFWVLFLALILPGIDALLTYRPKRGVG